MRIFPAAILPAAAVAWLAILCTAPMGLRHGIGSGAAVAAYQASSILCHQRAERSFQSAGVQMPVCARCFGLYAAGAFGAVAAWLLRRSGHSPSASAVRVALAAAAVPILLSVGLEWAGASEGSNLTRFASALPFGGAAGWFLQRVASAAGSAPCVIMP